MGYDSCDRMHPHPKEKNMKTEASEQITLIAMIDSFHPALSDFIAHIPNGGKRDAKTGALMKKMGVRPGWPDLVYTRMRGRYGALFIEMKRMKGGSTSQAQKRVHEALRGEGYRVRVCRGWREALETLLEYEDLGREWNEL